MNGAQGLSPRVDLLDQTVLGPQGRAIRLASFATRLTATSTTATLARKGMTNLLGRFCTLSTRVAAVTANVGTLTTDLATTTTVATQARQALADLRVSVSSRFAATNTLATQARQALTTLGNTVGTISGRLVSTTATADGRLRSFHPPRVTPW